MALEGGDLAARDDQQLVVVRLEFRQRLEVAGGIVVGHRHEIEAPRHRRVQGFVNWTGRFCTRLSRAGPIRVPGVQVQVTAIPAGFVIQRRGGEPVESAASIQSYGGGVGGAGVLAQVRNTQDQLPFAHRQRPRQIGRRRPDLGQGEGRLVPAAPAPEPLGIADAEVDDRLLILACVGERYRNGGGPGGYLERDLAIGLMVGTGHHAGERQVRLGLGRRRCCDKQRGDENRRACQPATDQTTPHQKRYSTAALYVRPSSGRAR